MKNSPRIFLAIASLALAVLACQAMAGGPANTAVPADTNVPDATTPPLPTQPETSSSNGDVLLDDDFSASRTQWGTGTNENRAIEYVDDALNFKIIKKNFIVWSYPNESDYENIHMEVTVINNGTDPNTAFGFKCDIQHPLTDPHYYLVITPGGEYAIVKASLALDDVVLTNNGEWGKSDLIAKDATSYRMGADCGNGKLTLYVDGQQIASVDDSTYTSGGFALMVWSGEDAANTNVSFDDFKMTQLP